MSKPTAKNIEKKQQEEEVKKARAFETEYKQLCAKHGWIHIPVLKGTRSSISAGVELGKLSEEEIKKLGE
jgi:calcineurin-like phosphoesterase family protein